MKFKLEDNIELYEEITEIYKNSVIDILKVAEKKLIDIFQEIFKHEAKNFGLVTKSSVTNVSYFSLKSRVKKADSFSEKLVRKDIGITLLKEYGTTKEEINKNKPNLINKLQKLDDIVGLRIVTELREDTTNAYKLILENITLFESKKVIFFDIKVQPQIMKNGLDIYRIKGEYDGLVCFELQIKSKIDEAWGEMDHTIFYKDHASSLIKPTVQKTMNNVGIILEKLETLLYDLRNSSQIFDANSSFIEFENNLYKKYNEPIASVFKQSIPLTEISKILYFFKDKEKIDTELNKDINFTFLGFTVEKYFNIKFAELTHCSHNLIIIEALYHCLKKSYDGNLEIDQANYEVIFEQFFIIYLGYLDNEMSTGEFISNTYYEIMKNNYKFILNNGVITNRKKIKQYRIIHNLITDTLEDNETVVEVINNLYFLAFFSSDFKTYYQEINDNLEFNLATNIDLVESQSSDYENETHEIIKNLSQSLKKIIQ